MELPHLYGGTVNDANEDALERILRDSKHDLTIFDGHEKTALSKQDCLQGAKGSKRLPFVKCILRDKDIRLTPEEVVRSALRGKAPRPVWNTRKNRLAFEHVAR